MLWDKKALPLELAKKMADAVEKKALELGLKIVVAIVDEGGNLKYFRRMDGAAMGSVRVAQLKAGTSASFPLSTKEMAERNSKYAGGPYAGGAIPGIVLLEGGLPILTKERAHLGGIGVSGATSEQDGVCAHAGLEAIREWL
jgi:uncharacterized protein GlcG (DUF336 family)